MATLVLVNTAPYGSEGPYNALRLVQALLLKEEWVELFFMGDGVHTARVGQQPMTAHASLEAMLREALDKGAQVSVCGTCCRARGVTEGELIDGVHIATINDLAGLVLSCEHALSF